MCGSILSDILYVQIVVETVILLCSPIHSSLLTSSFSTFFSTDLSSHIKYLSDMWRTYYPILHIYFWIFQDGWSHHPFINSFEVIYSPLYLYKYIYLYVYIHTYIYILYVYTYNTQTHLREQQFEINDKWTAPPPHWQSAGQVLGSETAQGSWVQPRINQIENRSIVKGELIQTMTDYDKAEKGEDAK